MELTSNLMLGYCHSITPPFYSHLAVYNVYYAYMFRKKTQLPPLATRGSVSRVLSSKVKQQTGSNIFSLQNLENLSTTYPKETFS